MNDLSPSLDDLERTLARFLDGEFSATQLQLLFWEQLAPATEQPNRDPAVQLWHGVVTNVGYYLYCDFERTLLEESLRSLMTSVRTTGKGCLTPITTSSCFFESLRNRTIPAPFDPRHFTSTTVPPLESARSTECPSDSCE